MLSAEYRYRLILWVAVLVKGSRRSSTRASRDEVDSCRFTSTRISSNSSAMYWCRWVRFCPEVLPSMNS